MAMILVLLLQAAWCVFAASGSLSCASVAGAALAVTLVGAAPDGKAASSSCNDEEAVTDIMVKNLLMHKSEPTSDATAHLNESRAVTLSQEGWQGVADIPGVTRRRRRRDPTDTRRRRRTGRPNPKTSGDNCGDIELTFVSAKVRDADGWSSAGFSDPFAQFEYWLCGDDTELDDRPPAVRTPTIDNTLNPVWNFTTTVKSVDFDHKVFIQVLDADIGGASDRLGHLYGLLKDIAPPGEPATHVMDGYSAGWGTLTFGWKQL